mmetsp:Transcript_174094/g.558181  ORF Transcript_174094/g.558181 Transcript_174094/m.558181 type:complete len:221 (-) Transcript_174094:1971-2633(-)
MHANGRAHLVPCQLHVSRPQHAEVNGLVEVEVSRLQEQDQILILPQLSIQARYIRQASPPSHAADATRLKDLFFLELLQHRRVDGDLLQQPLMHFVPRYRLLQNIILGPDLPTVLILLGADLVRPGLDIVPLVRERGVVLWAGGGLASGGRASGLRWAAVTILGLVGILLPLLRRLLGRPRDTPGLAGFLRAAAVVGLAQPRQAHSAAQGHRCTGAYKPA